MQYKEEGFSVSFEEILRFDLALLGWYCLSPDRLFLCIAFGPSVNMGQCCCGSSISVSSPLDQPNLQRILLLGGKFSLCQWLSLLSASFCAVNEAGKSTCYNQMIYLTSPGFSSLLVSNKIPLTCCFLHLLDPVNDEGRASYKVGEKIKCCGISIHFFLASFLASLLFLFSCFACCCFPTIISLYCGETYWMLWKLWFVAIKQRKPCPRPLPQNPRHSRWRLTIVDLSIFHFLKNKQHQKSSCSKKKCMCDM